MKLNVDNKYISVEKYNTIYCLRTSADRPQGQLIKLLVVNKDCVLKFIYISSKRKWTFIDEISNSEINELVEMAALTLITKEKAFAMMI